MSSSSKYPPDTLRIALVPATTLGDGLLKLTAAQILQSNGYQVTVFHSLVSSMSSILDELDVVTLPDKEHLSEQLSLHS